LLALTWMLSTLTKFAPLLCSVCSARAENSGKKLQLSSKPEWAHKSMATPGNCEPSNPMTPAPLRCTNISRLLCPWVRSVQHNSSVTPSTTLLYETMTTTTCTCHQTMAQDHRITNIAQVWATKPVLLQQAISRWPGWAQTTINQSQRSSPSTPTIGFGVFTTQTLRWVAFTKTFALNATNMPTEKIQSNSKQTVSTATRFNRTSLLWNRLHRSKWWSPSQLHQNKNQYEASAEAKPSADRECNNFTKEKSSSTTSEEDDCVL